MCGRGVYYPKKQGQFDSLFRGQEKVVEQWVTFSKLRY